LIIENILEELDIFRDVCDGSIVAVSIPEEPRRTKPKTPILRWIIQPREKSLEEDRAISRTFSEVYKIVHYI